MADQAPQTKGARQGTAQRIDRLRAVAIMQAANGEQGRQLAALAAIERAVRFAGQPQKLGSNEVDLCVTSEDPGHKRGD